MPASCSETAIFPTSVLGPAAGDPRTAASVRSMGDSLNQRVRYLLYCFQQVYGQIAPVGGAPTPLVSWNSGTGVWNLPSHGLSNGQPIRFMVGNSGATNPASCPINAVLYAVVVDANNFNVSLTQGGSAVVPSGAFAGELYVIALTDPAIYTMAAGALPAGKLSAMLALFGQLGAAQTWALMQTFTAGLTSNGPINANGNVTVAGGVTVGGILAPQVAEAPKSKAINPLSTSFTCDASAPVWFLDTPFPASTAGATMTITLDSTALVPAADQEIEIVCENLNTNTATVVINRAGPVTLVTFTTPDVVASARFKFTGGKWRAVGRATGASTSCPSS